KPSRGKTSPQEKSISQPEGVYFNGRLMHATTSLIGSIVQIMVKSGNTYEGVLKTFSPEFEIVADMVVETDPKAVNSGQNIGCLLDSLRNKREVQNTMIFKLQDVIMLNLVNVDLDYASRGHFTDTEISRYDGQTPKSKDLVPWEGPPEKDGFCLDEDSKNAQNGWDAVDMFKLNEEKYQVSSTYDSSLQGYTVPLEIKDTDEYKQKQAEAEKIAQDIENDSVYKERIAKEDGDEEERFSAVSRPTNESPHSGPHSTRPSGRRKSQNSSSNSIGSGGRGKGPQNSSPLLPSPTSLHSKFQQQYHHQHQQNYSNKSPSTASPPSMPQKSVPKDDGGNKPPPNSTSSGSHGYNRNDDEYNSNQMQSQLPSAPLPQRNHSDNRRSNISKKREEVSNDFKKFSTDFKLATEVKELSVKDNCPKDVMKSDHVPSDKSDASKEKENKLVANAEVDKQAPSPHDAEPESDAEKVAKKSTLNPNAKEFNPSAKSFAPRVPAFTGPATPTIITTGAMINAHQQQAHQAHQTRMQSPVVAFQPQFVTPVQFAMAPNQYMLTPNMTVAPAFQPNNNTQNIRYRNKGPQQYQNQNNRHDYSQAQAQVAAATGHPVLATAPIPAPTQIPVPYNTQSQVPTSGQPQAVAYSTVYPVRMNTVSPQMMGVVPHMSYAADPNLHHFYSKCKMKCTIFNDILLTVNMSQVQIPPHMVAQAVAAQHSGGGQHSAPSTPQSGPPSTPLHAAPPTPSPVHHQGGGVPNQPPTPTPGLMYGGIPSHGGQTPVSVSSHSNNCTPHYVNQQMVPLILPAGQGMPHAQHPGTGHTGHVHPSLSHTNAAANHHGVSSSQAPLLSTMTIPVIPTSATIVGTPGAIQQHFAQNSQSRI
ncbi:Ataxin-2-like protein, partial [Dinothrombium tinctorium]